MQTSLTFSTWGRRRSSRTSSGTSTGPQVRNSCHASEKWSLRAPFSPARRRRTATACTRLCMARLALSIRGHGGPGRLRQRWGEPPPVCALQRWAISGTPSSPRAPARRAHTAAAHPRLYGAHLAPPGGQCGGPGWLRQRWGEISPGARTVHCRPRCGVSSRPVHVHDGPAQLRRAREPGERLALHLLGTTASPDGTASAGGRSLKLPAHSGAAGALRSGGEIPPEMGALCTCRRVHTVPGGWAPLHPHSLRNGDSPLPPQSLDMCTPRLWLCSSCCKTRHERDNHPSSS